MREVFGVFGVFGPALHLKRIRRRSPQSSPTDARRTRPNLPCDPSADANRMQARVLQMSMTIQRMPGPP